MSPLDNPYLLRRKLASRLRELRLEAKLSIEQVADHLLCSVAKISRLETGQRSANLRDVRDLCQFYKVDEQATLQLIEMARQSREPAWWEQFDLPESYRTFIGYESAAVSMIGFRSIAVPGIMQTEDYAQALIASSFPADAEKAQRWTDARMRRQQMLFGRERMPTIHIVLDEAVLYRVVGGPAVMAAQLEHLLELSRHHDITIQVLPFSVGAHAAVETCFTILTLDDERIEPLVNVEDVFGNLQIKDVDNATWVFERAAETALDPQDSRAVLASARRRFLDQDSTGSPPARDGGPNPP